MTKKTLPRIPDRKGKDFELITKIGYTYETEG